jgi:cytochrome c biogenesis protein CcmG/thiol:disulfide interchange protein DsbE
MQGMTRRTSALVCALTLLAAACTASSPSPGPSASPIPAVNAARAALLPRTVDEIPDMDLETYGALRLQVKGTPMVINMWASWCGPCKAEAPDLAAAAARYGDRIQFLGVDVQDNRGDAQDFVHAHGWPYPSVFDPSGAIMTHLGITGPPATFFYAADGSFVTSVPGQIAPEALDQALRQLLG